MDAILLCSRHEQGIGVMEIKAVWKFEDRAFDTEEAALEARAEAEKAREKARNTLAWLLKLNDVEVKEAERLAAVLVRNHKVVRSQLKRC